MPAGQHAGSPPKQLANKPKSALQLRSCNEVSWCVRFHKYQALGNDYLVMETGGRELSPAAVRRVCDRHFGVGSDGILIGAATADSKQFTLRIFNPDGSEAEKSGNGLRIYVRYLWDNKMVGDQPFEVVTKGGAVQCLVQDAGRTITVDMGIASFESQKIPVNGPKREVINERIEIDGQQFAFTGVTVGNPHCVIHTDEITPAIVKRYGPVLETHSLFPNRTNVQFVKILDRKRIQVEIWERGAGYTLASGSSSCAAAAASVRRGLCDGAVTVLMPGGQLQIEVSPSFAVRMTGPASKVADGVVAAELLAEVGYGTKG
jgi:diaminopimelate epimerase